MNLFPLMLLASFCAAAEPPLPPKLDLERIKIGDNLAASDDRRWIGVGEASIVTVWKLGGSRPIASFEWETDPSSGYLVPLAFSPDGRKLLIARSVWGKSIEFAIGDIESEKLVVKYPKRPSRCGEASKGGLGQCETFISASFSPDGTKIALRTRYFAGYVAHYNDLVLSLEGKILSKKETATRRDDDLVWVDAKGGVQGGCRYAPDGALVSARADAASCSVLDCETGKRLAFLDGCRAQRLANPNLDVHDGRLYASDATRIWDARTGDILRRIKPAPPADRPYSMRGNTATVDGRFLVRLDEDVRESKVAAVRVSILDAETGAVVASQESAVDASHSLSFIAPDASLVLTYDYTTKFLYLWRFPTTQGAAEPHAGTARADAPIDVDAVPAAAKTDSDAYAIVIGVEKYRQEGIPAVDYAVRDAQTMRRYLTGPMGFDPANVVLLTDARATKTDFEKHLGPWLKNRTGPKSRVFVYYAGHGSPNPKTGQGYLMPYEADPSYLDDTAYPLSKLYESLGRLPTKDVTVVLDACFSGQGGRSLIAKGTRPLVNTVQTQAEPNTVVLAAAASNQVSASFAAARHGLFTYHLLAGLRGEADAGEDGALSTAELFDYVRPAVERSARLQNVEQSPTLLAPAGASSRPWISSTTKERIPEKPRR